MYLSKVAKISSGNGALYLAPYDLNRVVLWREIKRAIGGRYFEGGFEQMEKAIRRMLKEGKVCIVKLLDYILYAIKKAKMHQLKPLAA